MTAAVTAETLAAFESTLRRRQPPVRLCSIFATARQEASLPHKTDQAGGAFNHDSAARVEAVVSTVRRPLSSAIDVTYAASMKLLSFPSRLHRAPSNPACKSAAPSWTSVDAARAPCAATAAAG